MMEVEKMIEAVVPTTIPTSIPASPAPTPLPVPSSATTTTAPLPSDWPNFCGMGSDEVTSGDIFSGDFFGDDIILADAPAAGGSSGTRTSTSSGPPGAAASTAAVATSTVASRGAADASNGDMSNLFAATFLESTDVGSTSATGTRQNSLSNLTLLGITGMGSGDGMGSFRPSTSFNDFDPLAATGGAPTAATTGSKDGKKRPLRSVKKSPGTSMSSATGPATAAADAAAAATSRPAKRVRSKQSSSGDKSSPLPDSVMSRRNGGAVLASAQAQISVGNRLEEGNADRKSTPNPLACPSTSVVADAIASPLPNLEAYRKAIEGAAATAAAIAVTARASNSASIKSLVRTMQPVIAQAAQQAVAQQHQTLQMPKITTQRVASIASQITRNIQKIDAKQVTQIVSAPPPVPPSTVSTSRIPSPVPSSDPDDLLGPNTSTAHVTALTSSNWAKVSTAIESIPRRCDDGGPGGPGDARHAKQNLSAEDRARQNRDRNREHARNTRLRKKAYVEELKRTLTEMVAQRDAQDREAVVSARRLHEQREIRFAVMQEFMNLRGRGNSAQSRWVAILEPGFVLTQPFTPYRGPSSGETNVNAGPPRISARGIHHNVHVPQQAINMVGCFPTAVRSCATTFAPIGINNGNSRPVRFPEQHDDHQQPLERRVQGPSELVADAASIAALLRDVGRGTAAWEETYRCPAAEGPTAQYLCDRTSFVMADNTAIVNWTATTVGLKRQGASAEIRIKGCMRSQYNPLSNKLTSTELVFDTAAVAAQLRRVTPSPEEAAHAEAAATADALLDSIDIGAAATFEHGATVTSSEAGSSAEEDSPQTCTGARRAETVATRRSTRRY